MSFPRNTVDVINCCPSVKATKIRPTCTKICGIACLQVVLSTDWLFYKPFVFSVIFCFFLLFFLFFCCVSVGLYFFSFLQYMTLGDIIHSHNAIQRVGRSNIMYIFDSDCITDNKNSIWCIRMLYIAHNCILDAKISNSRFVSLYKKWCCCDDIELSITW